MSSLSFDAQSLVIDGRRTWLVCGGIDYASLPRDLWQARLRDAKHAGLNCIATRVFWNAHEPAPGRYRFDDNLDLRHFVELAGREGLYCILRVGPYMGDAADLGGLPAWLLNVPGIRLRQSHPRFLEACARWFKAMMEQVADLQVTDAAPPSPTAVHPIVMMQVEHAWRCHHPAEAQAYLGELVRYLREEECQVPLIETNECWQQVEGLFSTWTGARDLATHMRQFRSVQQEPPAQRFPLLVSAYDVTVAPDADRGETTVDHAHLLRLSQAIAAGAQFSIEPFVGSASNGAAPLSSTGQRHAGYAGIRRIATFASHFGHVLAGLDPAAARAVAALDCPRGVSVVHHRGSQGDVVFLFRGTHETSRQTDIVLPDGRTVTVPLGDEPVTWLLMNVNLAGSAQLDYTNLRPWASLGRLLVLDGPAGAAGVVCLDHAEVNVTVPTGPLPLVVDVDDVTVVVLSTEQADASWLSAAGLVVGASGLDANDQPMAHPKFKRATLIRGSGEMTTLQFAAPVKRQPPPRLGRWQMASQRTLIDGTSAAFAPSTGPASLESFSPEPRGWYRLRLKSKTTGLLMAPAWRGRIQLFSGGRCAADLGDGGDMPFTLSGSRELVAFASGSRRACNGWSSGDAMGLAGPLYSVKRCPLKPPRVLRDQPAPDPTELTKFLTDFSFTDRQICDAMLWQVRAGRGGLIVELNGLPVRAMLLSRGKPVGLYDPVHSNGRAVFTLPLGQGVRAGSNEIRLALFEKFDKAFDPRKFIRVHAITANLTEKAEWSLAPWTTPADESFKLLRGGGTNQPAWYRTTFSSPDSSALLALELAGCSRGQVFLNGRHAGDYAAPPSRAASAPRVPLPASWLRRDAENELMIFDEQGAAAAKCRLTFLP